MTFQYRDTKEARGGVREDGEKLDNEESKTWSQVAATHSRHASRLEACQTSMERSDDLNTLPSML